MPDGLFNWFGAFYNIPDTYVLNHHSLDGYLFLRLLKISVVICLVGCVITMPVLFPINATGGGPKTQLEILTMANCVNNYYKYFAHAGCAIIFFSFVIYMITRESIYFINLRQAYFMSPYYASRLSSRISRVAISRSFVGSSSSRRSAGSSMSLAMRTRARSPPERRETGWLSCSLVKRNLVA